MRPWYTDKKPVRTGYGIRRINQFSSEWGIGAPVVKYLIGINVGIWLIMGISGLFNPRLIPEFWYTNFAMSPNDVFREFKVHQVLTSMFMHDAMGIFHVLFNMYFLWVFGTRLERAFKSKTFLIFYLVSGLGGAILSLVTHMIGGDWYTYALGASAAIFGIMVAYGYLFFNEYAYLFGIWKVKVWILIAGLVALEAIFLIFQLVSPPAGGGASVDHWAHLGGALTAIAWMLIWANKPSFRNVEGRSRMPMPLINKKSAPGQRLFKVIIHSTHPMVNDHPEGTDDEPPPEWFDLKK